MGTSKIKLNLKKESKASAAIQAVYDSHGSTRKAAKIVGDSYELLSRWKRDGRVPLRRVADVAKSLKCSPYILNDKEVSALVDLVKEWENDCVPN